MEVGRHGQEDHAAQPDLPPPPTRRCTGCGHGASRGGLGDHPQFVDASLADLTHDLHDETIGDVLVRPEEDLLLDPG